MAKYKLNKVIEPFTQEDIENIYSETYGDDAFYVCYTNDNVEDVIAVEPVINDDVITGVDCYYYDHNTNEDKFSYRYVFESGIEKINREDVSKVGWYSYDNTTDAYTFVEGDIEIELPMEPTEAPSDWDPEWGEWVNPWITPYFYKVVTEVVEENPEQPEQPDYVEPKEIEYKIKRSTLVAIADAIREKTGSSDLIKVTDLDDAIKELSAGGSGSGGSIIEVEVLPEDVSTVKENDIYKTYVLEPEKVAIPGPDSGKTITKVKFNASLSDEEMIEVFKTIFPTLNDTENAFSHTWEETYIYYQDANNNLRFAKDNFDSGTKWQLSIGINNGSGNSENIWGCTINKNDNTIYSSGGWTPNLDATNIDVNVNPTTLEGYEVGVHNEALKSVVYTDGEEVLVPKLYIYNNGWKELTTK